VTVALGVESRKMATYLLTWNPVKYPWEDIDYCIDEIHKHGHFRRYWSCGRSKKPVPGDKFYVLRQKLKPRGIMASGYITSEPYKDYSPHNKSGWSQYVWIVYDTIINPIKTEDKIFPRIRLDEPDFSKANWDTQVSGIQIPDEVVAKLDEEWFALNEPDNPNTLDIVQQFIEGSRQQIYTTSYERNPKARVACLEFHGYSCAVCDFNFEEVFGDIGKNYIHVHHLRPLSEIGSEYVIDPIKDLCPVCPNCHAMLHRKKDEDFNSIEELKKIVEINSQQIAGEGAG